MTREMLFRGKRVDNDEWLESNSINVQADIFGREHVYMGVPVKYGKHPNGYYIEWHEVIPETVGQYTGLPDKNGKKIFKGDLLKCESNLVWLVAFEDGAFVCKDDENVTYFTFYEHREYNSKTKKYENFIPKDFEIIGNIHDNPDFLKGE